MSELACLGHPPWSPPLPLAQRLLHLLPGVSFHQKPDFTLAYVSPAIEAWTGLSAETWEQGSQAFWSVVHEADASDLRKQVREHDGRTGELRLQYRIRHRSSSAVTYIAEVRRWVYDEAGNCTGFDGFWTDITRQCVAEKRLNNAAWKENLAVLTMGLAHDFNNLMAGILSLTETFLDQVDAKHPFHEGLRLIKQNGFQASQLVRRIIDLHNVKIGDRQFQDLNAIASETVDLLRKVIPRRIETSIELCPDELPICVDPVELCQVIINLALNAADAMPNGGRLVLRTFRCEDIGPFEHHQGQIPRMPAVCLSVSDTGCGIPGNKLPSIFNPYFTTKPAHKGAGLGLYNTQLFVEKHQALIAVKSEEGLGTTFWLYLPLTDLSQDSAASPQILPARRSILLAGKPGKSLDSIAEFLRLHEFLVVIGGEHALEILRLGEYTYDGLMVVIDSLDVDFLTLLDEARTHRPQPKTILQIVGCNQDEIKTQLLVAADLIIGPDSLESMLVEQLNATLSGHPPVPAP